MPAPPTMLRVRGVEAEEAEGVVVVIDVIRAFTVAAYALAGGAERLWLVRTIGEAFALRERAPHALLAGERGGRTIPGFDLNNSPARMARSDVRGRLIIQVTGAGTQGAARAVRADRLFVSSLVVARATAESAATLAGETGLPITFVATGIIEGSNAEEDDICADYMEALIERHEEAARVVAEGEARLRASGRLDVFTAEDADLPADDVPHFLAVDRFPFTMPGERRELDGLGYVEVRRAD